MIQATEPRYSVDKLDSCTEDELTRRYSGICRNSRATAHTNVSAGDLVRVVSRTAGSGLEQHAGQLKLSVDNVLNLTVLSTTAALADEPDI